MYFFSVAVTNMDFAAANKWYKLMIYHSFEFYSLLDANHFMFCELENLEY